MARLLDELQSCAENQNCSSLCCRCIISYQYNAMIHWNPARSNRQEARKLPIDCIEWYCGAIKWTSWGMEKFELVSNKTNCKSLCLFVLSLYYIGLLSCRCPLKSCKEYWIESKNFRNDWIEWFWIATLSVHPWRFRDRYFGNTQTRAIGTSKDKHQDLKIEAVPSLRSHNRKQVHGWNPYLSRTRFLLQ